MLNKLPSFCSPLRTIVLALVWFFFAIQAPVLGVATAKQPGGDASSAPDTGLAEPRPLDIKVIQAAVGRLAGKVKKHRGALGVAVVDVSSGRLVAQHQPEKALNPASNVKVLTAWAALRALGPQHRYLTGFYGKLRNGHVAELVVRGDGDPSLELRHLWEMVARMKRAGLRSIGDILVDQSYFDTEHLPPAFGQQPNEWASFRAPVAALSLGGNTVMFEVRPGVSGSPAKIHAVPRSFVSFRGRVMTSEAEKPEAVRLSLAPEELRLKASFGGTIPEGSRVVRVWRRVDDPSLLVGYGIRSICEQLGITLKGEVKLGGGPQRRLLSAHRSEPLGRLLAALGKHSNNFYAEMVFKSLSVAKQAPPASFERSAQALLAMLGDTGIAMTGSELKNGSGLFDANRFSARVIAEVLAHAYRDPKVGPELVAQLAIGGLDGTLRHRFSAWKAQRAIRAKTGTLAAVSALSGYVVGPDASRALAFSVIINGAKGQAVALRRDIDAMVSTLADVQY